MRKGRAPGAALWFGFGRSGEADLKMLARVGLLARNLGSGDFVEEGEPAVGGPDLGFGQRQLPNVRVALAALELRIREAAPDVVQLGFVVRHLELAPDASVQLGGAVGNGVAGLPGAVLD